MHGADLSLSLSLSLVGVCAGGAALQPAGRSAGLRAAGAPPNPESINGCFVHGCRSPAPSGLLNMV